MHEPYDTAGELTKLATSIDTRLDNERADRQYIAEQAIAGIQDVLQAMITVRAQANGAAPPLETEQQARELPAVRAVYEAFSRNRGVGRMVPHNREILASACEQAGVQVGAFDSMILGWLAGWNPSTCAVVAGLITRAARGTR